MPEESKNPQEQQPETPPNPSPENKPETVVSDAPQIDKLTSEMPQVVPDAVDAAKAKETAAQAENANIKDRSGRPFDPALHAVDENGKAILTPTGRFKKLTNPRPVPGLLQLPPQGDPNAANEAELKMYSVIWADLFINFGITVFGDEWKPTKEAGYNERDTIIAANEAYFREAGIVKPPAWAGLATAYGLYTLRRLNQPRTRTVFGKISDGLRRGFVNLVSRFRGVKPPEKKTEKPEDKK